MLWTITLGLLDKLIAFCEQSFALLLKLVHSFVFVFKIQVYPK